MGLLYLLRPYVQRIHSAGEGACSACERRDVHRFELHGKSANMLFELESSL